jgi:hypothetical protein
MGASATPIMKYLNLAAGATGTIDFGQNVGWIHVRNGGTKTVFMAVGDTPPTPSNGDGRIAIGPDQPLKMGNISLAKLSFAMAALEAAYVEVVGVPVLANH